MVDYISIFLSQCWILENPFQFFFLFWLIACVGSHKRIHIYWFSFLVSYIFLQHFIHQFSSTCNLVLKTNFYFKLVKKCFKSLLSRWHHTFKWHMGAKTQLWATHAPLNHYFFQDIFTFFKLFLKFKRNLYILLC